MARPHRQSIRVTSNHATALFALLLLVATATRPAFAEISPRGQRMASDIKYGDWRKLCFKPGGAKAVCRTSITGTFDTGQTAVRLDLIEREGDHTARLQMFVPVGMFVQAGGGDMEPPGPPFGYLVWSGLVPYVGIARGKALAEWLFWIDDDACHRRL